jgi:hypothetical protein
MQITLIVNGRIITVSKFNKICYCWTKKTFKKLSPDIIMTKTSTKKCSRKRRRYTNNQLNNSHGTPLTSSSPVLSKIVTVRTLRARAKLSNRVSIQIIREELLLWFHQLTIFQMLRVPTNLTSSTRNHLRLSHRLTKLHQGLKNIDRETLTEV